MFCEAWESQLCDMALLLREINDVFEGRRGTSLSSQSEAIVLRYCGEQQQLSQGETSKAANTELSHLIWGLGAFACCAHLSWPLS